MRIKYKRKRIEGREQETNSSKDIKKKDHRKVTKKLYRSQKRNPARLRLFLICFPLV